MTRLPFVLSVTLLATLLPLPSSAQQLECPNYWRNPETGELECLDLGSGRRSQPNAPLTFEQFFKNFETCTPSSSVIPSLFEIFGIDLINRAHIKGWTNQRCEVQYTFAKPEQPEQEATYLLCHFRPETLAEIATEGSVVLEDEEECQSFL